MTDWRTDRIGSALRGENPTVLARLPVWLYPPEQRNDPATALGHQHAHLRATITRYLNDHEPQ